MDDGRLPLDHPDWKTLSHRGGPEGKVDVPTELRALLANPGDDARFGGFWPYLCSEDTTWPAAYAATPYLVDHAAAVPATRRAGRVAVIGLIVTHSRTQSCPARLRDAHTTALGRALRLATETVTVTSGDDLRWGLSALAALRGAPLLAEVLANPQCPECGVDIPVDATP
ncbi:hypothetical protein ABZ816_33975 [Actinosynnema sp. NPDC047251]|nr:hypothetical protein [Saccharothrix espanaensis]